MLVFIVMEDKNKLKIIFDSNYFTFTYVSEIPTITFVLDSFDMACKDIKKGF